LNHVTTPHVLVASAVRASCALPGVMESATLLCKSETGEVQPYLLSSQMRWVDGSITSDIPRDRIAGMFNVTTFIVSQVNPHIVPWISKTTPGAQRRAEGLVRRICDHASADILRRCMALSSLGVIPSFFGQTIPGKMFSQKYLGNVNIVPALTLRDSFKAVMNPTVEDMQRYLSEGRRCSWSSISHIRFLMRIEQQLAVCKARVLSSTPARTGTPPLSFSGDGVQPGDAALDLQAMSAEEKDTTLMALWEEVRELRRQGTGIMPLRIPSEGALRKDFLSPSQFN
jgi:hypothetical protein